MGMSSEPVSTSGTACGGVYGEMRVFHAMRPNDFRAMDLIGYSATVPDSGSAMLLCMLLPALRRRRV
jgi:hypothetical protein